MIGDRGAARNALGGAGRACGNILRVGALRRRALEVLAEAPWTHRALRALARRLAGRHHVGAVAVVLDGDAVLVAEHPFRGGIWALPAGWINRHEDPFRAVEREVREELAIAVAAVEVVHCERQGPGLRRGPSALTIAFRCRLLDPGRPPVQLRSGEVRAAMWIDTARAADSLTGFDQQAVAAALRTVRTPPCAPGTG